jgi:hypothetical protein
MGFLNKLFDRKVDKAAPAEEPAAQVECPHTAVTARWDSAADMGKAELVSAYVCESCHATFAPEDGAVFVAAAAERMRVSEEARQERMHG